MSMILVIMPCLRKLVNASFDQCFNLGSVIELGRISNVDMLLSSIGTILEISVLQSGCVVIDQLEP